MIKKLLTFILIFSFVFVSFSSNILASNPKSIKKVQTVNINTAGIKQLTTLPGIGVKTAEKIIQFRKSTGKFKRKTDLLKVKGIGEKKFKKISNLISL